MVIFNSYVKLPEGISHDLECIEIFTFLACVSYITQYIIYIHVYPHYIILSCRLYSFFTP